MTATPKNEIKFASTTSGDKKDSAERKQTIQTWRSGIAKSIEKVLAPKGYSKIKHAPHRGTKKSTIDFLSDKHVIQVQNIAVGSFDMYRQNVKSHLTRQIELNKKGIEQAEKDLDAARFWKFALIAGIKSTIQRLKGQNEAFTQTIEQLNYIEAK